MPNDRSTGSHAAPGRANGIGANGAGVIPPPGGAPCFVLPAPRAAPAPCGASAPGPASSLAASPLAGAALAGGRVSPPARVRAPRRRARFHAPMSWSPRVRTLFVLAAPVAVPAWLLLLLFAGLCATVRASARAIYHFCTAPRRRRSRYYDGYR